MPVALQDFLRCPTCRGELDARPDALACSACGRLYELIHGIPDFRPDPEEGPRHSESTLEFIERWPKSSYRELWESTHSGGPDAPDALGRLWDEHEEKAPQRGGRRWVEILRAADAIGHPLAVEGTALDLGCGLGSALFALARRARLAVGLDIMLTSLLLAKKRFAEAGMDNVVFVCGSAMELAFREEAFDILNATDVVEHMPDQARFLAEARRVMRPGGAFFFNSPNRFSLFSPEPHVRLWFMGWLPRRWMEPYVNWRLRVPYRAKRLLSICELRRLLRGAFGSDFAIWSVLPRRGLSGALARLPNALAKPILPQHNVLAWKP
jgi:2-polyprenyl-3-methyl-5-hydroxy-6-metoxy-1,4-benzoquinol methylase/uncharacterized protein YbaR (Trm112 family)